MQKTPIRLGKVSGRSLSLEREREARFSGGDASPRAPLENVDRFFSNLKGKSKILVDDVTAHAFVLVVLRNMCKRSKISRPLAYVWMQYR